MRKKKNKVAKLTKKDYENYIASLKDSRPTKVIAGGKTEQMIESPEE